MNNALRSLVLVLIAAALCCVANAGSRVSMAAPVVPVSLEEALGDAQALKQAHKDASIVQVSGSSMHPFFGQGSLLVVKPIEVSKLGKGMVVLYRNHHGELVAHRLVSRQAGGWVAQGYNNSQPDSTLVNEANLRGVVYATIHTAGASAPAAGLEVALAAPAR